MESLTLAPTPAPTASLTSQPTLSLTLRPTESMTEAPTPAPTLLPTSQPTFLPMLQPTESPTPAPTPSPTHAHHFDERDRVTVVHADISLDQFLIVDGVYKLNSFNRASFSRGIQNMIDNVELRINSIREM